MNISKNNDYVLAVAWSGASLISALVFMPKFREMNYTSAYEVSSHSILAFIKY